MFSIYKMIPFFEKSLLPKTRLLVTTEKNLKYETSSSLSTKSDLPSPPKRPMTAYLIFCKQNRKSILGSNPSLKTSQQVKLLAKKWNSLSPEAKKVYEDIAREETIAYGQAHKEFYESLTEDQKEELFKLKAEKKEARKELRLKRAFKESGLPKPPNSAYTIFLQKEAKTKDNLSLSEFSKKVASIWRNMSEDVRQYYVDQAKKEKEMYEIEMRNWREKLIKEDNTELLNSYDASKQKTRGTVSVVGPKSSSTKKKAGTVDDDYHNELL